MSDREGCQRRHDRGNLGIVIGAMLLWGALMAAAYIWTRP